MIITYSVYEHLFPNGKRYFGITAQRPERRWQNGRGYTSQYFMNRAIHKYGWENIKHNILHSGLAEQEAKLKEKYYIEKYKTNDLAFGYNRTTGGDAHITRPVVYNGRRYQSLESFRKSENLSLRTVGTWLTEGVPMDPKYYDGGLKYEDQDTKIIRNTRSFKSRIICDGTEYASLREFCRMNNLNSGTVSHWLKGDSGMPEVWFNKGLRYLDRDNEAIYKAARN